MKGFWKLMHDKLQLKSGTLILLSAFYFAFVLNITFWLYVVKNIQITGFNVLVFMVSLVFAMLAYLLIAFNILFVPYITKPLLITLLLISSSTNYMMYKFGIFIDSDMVGNFLQTNTREALDFLTVPSAVSFIFTGLLPAALVLLCKINYKPFWQEIRRRFALILSALLICFGFAAVTYKEYAAFGRNNKEVRRLINPGNYIYAAFRYYQAQFRADKTFSKLDEEAAHAPYEDGLITVIVFVVGETSRAKNFSLYGYERETNPLLAKQDIITFHEVNSCGTSTAVSVPCIFSNFNRSDFSASDAKYSENLVDLAKQSGYDIIWLENDDGCKGVCDRVYTEVMKEKNNPEFCDGRYCKDEVLIHDLEERIRNIKKDTFIVLHTMGSHGPTYFRRYPQEFRKFTPTCDTADIQTCTREEVINTYDNTILYTDYIVSSAIDILKKFPQHEAGLLYVSDHGESLGENNIYLHGFPYKFAPKEQIEVPMVMWMSQNMKTYDYIDYACMKKEAAKNKYSHDNLFHSFIGLLEIKSKVYDNKQDMFAPCRTKELPGYSR